MKKRSKRAARIISGASFIKKLLNRPALVRNANEDDQYRLLIPGRMSAEELRRGSAEILDLHNVTALLNVALVLAHNVGEIPAREAIQSGIFAMAEIKDRPGQRYAMNAQQREFVTQAVDLADELFCDCTLLELATAHSQVLRSLPKTGTLEVVQVEIA